jgi:hypothetical protein
MKAPRQFLVQDPATGLYLARTAHGEVLTPYPSQAAAFSLAEAGKRAGELVTDGAVTIRLVQVAYKLEGDPARLDR